MKVGFIGLGDMGLPMARRLLAAGHEVFAWNRSGDKLRILVNDGANAAGSPAEVMCNASVVGLCLTSDSAVSQVALGVNGLFSAAETQGKVIADFSTGTPEAAVGFALQARRCGAAWVDSPVSGGVPAASAGTLIVFAGGEARAIASLAPLLSAVAARVSHMGPSGTGQMTKICNQMIVASNLLVIAETFAMARKAGVNVIHLAEALKGGFADSLPLQIFAPRMAAHRFEPRLGAIALMEKDVELASAIAERVSAHFPILKLARSIYNEVHTTSDVAASADLSRLIGLFEVIQ